MPNKFYADFAGGKMQSPGSTRSPDPPMKMGGHNWPKAPGPKGMNLNPLGWPEVKKYASQDLGADKYLSKGKAKEMMKDGKVHGKALTKKQKGFFGAVAGGASRKKGY